MPSIHTADPALASTQCDADGRSYAVRRAERIPAFSRVVGRDPAAT